MSEDILTQKELKQLLDYDPSTGEFRWKVSRRGVRMDSVAGTPSLNHKHGNTYVNIIVNRRKYSAHRLAWFYVHGEWPKDEIDHINHNGQDNRLENLKTATRKENAKNLRLARNNRSGASGVHSLKGKWMAEIDVNGKRIYLGYFTNKDDAVAARKVAEKHYGYSGNHGT